MFDKEFISRLKEANPIVDVARELGVNVPSSGFMRCFFPEEHARGDSVPSMRFDLRRNNVRCWGCNRVRWDVIGLVSYLKDYSPTEAIEWLAARAKMELPVRSAAGFSGSKKTELPLFQHRQVLTAFAQEAERRIDRGGMAYLASRGISEEVVRRQHLGFVDDYNDVMDCVRRKHPDISLKAAGLTSFYVYGQNKIRFVTIPYDGGNQNDPAYCVYLRARRVTESKLDLPKMLGLSSNIPIFFNAPILSSTDIVFVAEGEIDALTLLTHGYPAVGLPGATVFKPQWRDFFEGKQVNLVMDADRAGRIASRNIAKQIGHIAKGVWRVNLPPTMDVNDYFLTQGGGFDD